MRPTTPIFFELLPPERQAFLERLAATLERNARWAAEQGDEALDLVLSSVGQALMTVADDLAVNDPELAQDVAFRAFSLISAFHSKHPQYPMGLALH